MGDNLTLEQRVHNAAASQEVERIKAEHAYLHAIGHSREEWDRLWSRSDNATWAHRFGKMIGYGEIWAGCVIDMDRQCMEGYKREVAAYPEVATKDYRSVGSAGLHILASPIIEVAEDGMTARCFYQTPGTALRSLNPDGHKFTAWGTERYGSDFVYENGEWLYFHEQVSPDIGGPYDNDDWAHKAYYEEVTGDYGPMGKLDPAGGGPEHITERGLTHASYSTLQTVQNTLPYPVPYTTMDDDNTYSVGHTSL